MSLITIAVVSAGNFPLYLRDFDDFSQNNRYGLSTQNNDTDDNEDQLVQEDPFGFFEKSKSRPNDSSSLKNQFIVHSALDKFNELIRPEHMKSRPTVGPNSMYIGLLGCYDDLKVYGYNTSTKTKFLAAVEDSIHDENQQFIREAGLKALFANMHELYVEYNLNPFSSIRENKKITSSRFDAEIGELVETFNETYGKQGGMEI